MLGGINDFDEVRSTMAGQNQGRTGIFAQSREDTLAQLWPRIDKKTDHSYTVVQWNYKLYTLSLPTDPMSKQLVYEFDDFIGSAIDLLPPMCIVQRLGWIKNCTLIVINQLS